MPIVIPDPIVIPPKSEIVCDKLSILNLNISLNLETDTYVGRISVCFYNEVNGKRTYARDDKGNLKIEEMLISDLYLTAAKYPSLAIAISKVLESVAELYQVKKQKEAASPVSDQPPTIFKL